MYRVLNKKVTNEQYKTKKLFKTLEEAAEHAKNKIAKDSTKMYEIVQIIKQF